MTRAAVVILLACLIATSVVRADDSSRDDAIASALAWLARQQNSDGSFEQGRKPAATALALLAYLSAGQTSDGGRYANVVRRATEHLLRAPSEKIAIRDRAVTTLALCQVYGVEPDEQVRSRIRVSIKEIIPILLDAPMDDPTIARLCDSAFHAAAAIGFLIPKENLDRVAAYLAAHPGSSPGTQSADLAADASYFAMQSLFRSDPSAWQSAADSIVSAQQDDGGWLSVEQTSVNILTLTLPLRLIPSGLPPGGR